MNLFALLCTITTIVLILIMQTISVGRYYIEYGKPGGIGTTWLVRLYERRFPFKRRVSSDWFLDEAQAVRFVHDMEKALKMGSDAASVSRKPGWTFHRPAH